MASCANLDDAQYKDIRELVPREDSAVVGVEGGSAELIIYSSGEVEVEPMNDFTAFATLNKTHFTKDDTLRVQFSSNEGFRRMARLRLVLDGGVKTDTVRFLQNGLEAHLLCNSPFSTVDGTKDSSAEFELDTDVDLSEISTEISYISGSEGWITGVTGQLPKVIVSTGPNPSEHISKARVHLGYIDGWGEELSVNLFITASDKTGDFGTKMEFAAVKDLAGKGPIAEDYYIKCQVISDFRSKNTDLNPSVSYSKVDVTESDRTAYVQTEDGSMGLRLKYDDPADNVLMPGMLISLSLQGLSIEKDADADCWTAYGLSAESIVESAAGDGVTPKVRKISELSDEDIFTFVEIPNTEFVWKDGCYANVYENYALKSDINSMCSGNNNRFDGWATLLVDEDGKAIYAPVNMLCLWRRNSGKPVPQGKGSVVGIIVHNNISRYGDTGRYQIRVIDEKGFRQEPEGEGIYTSIAEFTGKVYQYRNDNACYDAFNSRYKDPGSSDRANSIIPSDDICAEKRTPAAELTCENKARSASYPSNAIWHYYSHNSLNVNGTSGAAGDRGRASNSSFNDGKACALQLNHEIKGWFKWNEEKIVGYNGIIIETSTSGLTGSNLNLSYAFAVGRISAATSQYFPAHWCTEYSIDGGTTWTLCPDAATGKPYVHLHAMPWYDVNIGGIMYRTCSSCGIGATEHIAMLSADALGVDRLLVKIRPYDEVMSIFPIEWNGNVENSKVYHNTTADVGLNIEYIHLRYKK